MLESHVNGWRQQVTQRSSCPGTRSLLDIVDAFVYYKGISKSNTPLNLFSIF